MQIPTDEFPDMSMDSNALYREEVYTDRRVGTIRALTPVTAGGQAAPDRSTIYIGQAQIMTPSGALPVTFDIPAATLHEAVSRFATDAQQGVEDTIRELEQMRIDAASSIVVPGSGNMGGGGIQMP